MKVLITGAGGFIGKKTGEYFVRQGYDVVGWDRFPSENGLHVEAVNMLDQALVEEALGNCKPDIIIHCAGSADVGNSVRNPYADFQGNVGITHNLLFSLRKMEQNPRIVYISSAGVYGNQKTLPIREDAELNPMSPYALHKQMCEKLCQYMISNYQADIKMVRIFSAYGAGLRKQIFWDMSEKIKKTGRLDMFGTGEESRDFIHVDDVVQALYLLALTDSPSTLFNVANGEEIRIRQIAEHFAEYSGIGMDKICFNNEVREGDPKNWKADISRMQEIGYKKTVSIGDGIRDYVRWCREQE